MWFRKLKEFLLLMGFHGSRVDPLLFLHLGEYVIYLLVHVDDMIIIGSCQDEVNKFLTDLGKLFAIRYLGDLSYFLGVQVGKMKEDLFLDQQQYLVNILMVILLIMHVCIENY